METVGDLKDEIQDVPDDVPLKFAVKSSGTGYWLNANFSLVKGRMSVKSAEIVLDADSNDKLSIL